MEKCETFKFVFPTSIDARTSSDAVYVTDKFRCCVYQITKKQRVERIAGGAARGLVDGPFAKSCFVCPWSVVSCETAIIVLDDYGTKLRVMDIKSRTVATVNLVSGLPKDSICAPPGDKNRPFRLVRLTQCTPDAKHVFGMTDCVKTGHFDNVLDVAENNRGSSSNGKESADEDDKQSKKAPTNDRLSAKERKVQKSKQLSRVTCRPVQVEIPPLTPVSKKLESFSTFSSRNQETQPSTRAANGTSKEASSSSTVSTSPTPSNSSNASTSNSTTDHDENLRKEAAQCWLLTPYEYPAPSASVQIYPPLVEPFAMFRTAGIFYLQTLKMTPALALLQEGNTISSLVTLPDDIRISHGQLLAYLPSCNTLYFWNAAKKRLYAASRFFRQTISSDPANPLLDTVNQVIDSSKNVAPSQATTRSSARSVELFKEIKHLIHPGDLSSLIGSPVVGDICIRHPSTSYTWYLHTSVLRFHSDNLMAYKLLDLLNSYPDLDEEDIQAFVDYMYYVPLKDPKNREECERLCRLAVLTHKAFDFESPQILSHLLRGLSHLNDHDASHIFCSFFFSSWLRTFPSMNVYAFKHPQLLSVLGFRMRSTVGSLFREILPSYVKKLDSSAKKHLIVKSELLRRCTAGSEEIMLPPLEPPPRFFRPPEPADWYPFDENMRDMMLRIVRRHLAADATLYALCLESSAGLAYFVVQGSLLYSKWPLFRQLVAQRGPNASSRILTLPQCSIAPHILAIVMHYFHLPRPQVYPSRREAIYILKSAKILGFVSDSTCLTPIPALAPLIAECEDLAFEKHELTKGRCFQALQFSQALQWTPRIRSCTDFISKNFPDQAITPNPATSRVV